MSNYSLETKIFTLIRCFVLYAVGTTGNALIIWTFVAKKELRVIPNIFVVCLAFVDLFIVGYLLPFCMYVMLVNDAVIPTELCQTNAILSHVVFTTSVQYIMYIAVIRYFKICRSTRFKQIFTVSKIIPLIISSPSIGFIFALPLFIDNTYWTFDHTLHLCLFNRFASRTYSLIYMTACLLTPVFITACAYYRIYCYVIKTKKRLRGYWKNTPAGRRLKKEILITRSQFAVFVSYLILYLPFGITTFGSSANDFPEAFHSFAMYFCFANSCMNSILYGVFNRDMRKAYKNALCKNKSAIEPMNRVTVSSIETRTSLESAV